ncbi:MAG: nitroreductase family deazaflavin-dependent oxidoreductase [Candidatus Limnocylindrales bacterium]
MDERIDRALSRGHTIDITTTGRKTGQARRIEIVFHVIDGHVYITGMASPRRRSWLANLEADPRFTFHLKGAVRADLPATARIISDEDERRAIFREIVKTWTNQQVETMTRYSPLIEVTFEALAA